MAKKHDLFTIAARSAVKALSSGETGATASLGICAPCGSPNGVRYYNSLAPKSTVSVCLRCLHKHAAVLRDHRVL